MVNKSRKSSGSKSTSPRRKRARSGLPAKPSSRSREITDRASKRVKERSTPIRNAFIVRPWRQEDEAQRPPLARLLRHGSRGGAVRLRLLLALLWQAGGGDERHTVNWPARAWAELLDLRDPDRLGERRVREGLRALRQLDLVASTTRPGFPSTLTLRRDDGTGLPYTPPGEEAKQAKAQGVFDERHAYVQLPASFWTQGWALALTGPGLALLLVMLVLTQGGDKEDQWISPASAREHFCLSEDTWTRGVAELREQGLLRVRKRPVSEDFSWRRVRNTYSLHLQRLDAPPSWS
jgi:hypothetical protein